jgi:NCAIR mutase (PurE)-related protein
LLKQVKTGKIGVDEAINKLRHLPFEDLGFAHIDHHRQLRCGFPEVIYCPGKTAEQIIKIFSNLTEKGNNILATRAEESVYRALAKTKKFPKVRYEKAAKAIIL